MRRHAAAIETAPATKLRSTLKADGNEHVGAHYKDSEAVAAFLPRIAPSLAQRVHHAREPESAY